MTESEVRALAQEADRLRVEYLDAFNHQDLDTALQIGAEQLVPVSEQLVEADQVYLEPFGVTLRNLAALCHRLERPIGGFYFSQRALDVACVIESRNLPLHQHLADVGEVTVDFALRVVYGHPPQDDRLPEPEQQLVVPAVALVPRSIECMAQIDSIPWAAQLRLAATALRHLNYRPKPEVLDHESRAIVWMARLAHERGDRDFAEAEIGDALTLWIEQLDPNLRYWSIQLAETWTVAAELLQALSRHESAASIRRVVRQAVAASRGAGLTNLAYLGERLDLREHYRAALAALGNSGGDVAPSRR